jgi:hypothetical protein
MDIADKTVMKIRESVAVKVKVRVKWVKWSEG